MQTKIQTISIDEIDTKQRKFKVSRNNFSENLPASIKKYGVLNPVYLVKNINKLEVIFGFNRIECALKSGLEFIPAIIDDTMDENYFISQSVIKLFNNEIGPSGKIKLIKTLYDQLNFTNEKIEGICSDFSIPAYLSEKRNVESFLSFPNELLNYFDSRDVQFKIIDKILKLDKAAIKNLASWADKTKMKLNIFKLIVDMLFDIKKSGIDDSALHGIFPENIEDKNIAENAVYESVFNLRYPDYSRMFEKSARIKNSLAARKVIAEIPKFFDGGSFFIKIPVDTKSGYAGLKNKFDLIKQEEIEEIIKLL